MNRWVARLMALVLAAAAVYLVYANVHAPSIVLESTLAAAVLTIAGVFLLWKRPLGALIINAVWLAGAFVASASLTSNHQLPALVSSSRQELAQPPASQTQAPAAAGFVAKATVNPAASAMPSMQPATGALSAPQPDDFDYSYFIGHGTIDDGMPQFTYSQQATHAVGLAAAAFGGPSPTPLLSTTAQKLVDADAKLPESEYSLEALGQTLPNDPIAIYRFVRDNITIDPYDGIMRGPLGTWMSRSGSSSDKLSLLAWLLVNKHIHIQFVRGTLSEDERNRIVRSALSLPNDSSPQPPPDATAEAATDAYVNAGKAFSQWSSQQLASSNVSLGSGNTPQISAKHYWVQIDQNGKLFDLDPTLPDTNDGEHLGTIDPSFKPWAMPPDDEFHYVRILLTGKFKDGTQQQIVSGIGKVCDLAYAALRLVLVPATGGNLSDIPAARKFNVWLVSGSSNLAPQAQLDLDVHGGIDELTLEIDRKDTSGQVLTSVRDLLSAGTPRELQGPVITGLTSILIVPGLGSNAFELHALLRTMAEITNAVESARGGSMKPPPAYPLPLAAFFARDESVADRFAQSTNGRFYRNRPDIALERMWYRLDGGKARAVLGFDIVDNSMASVGIDPSQAAIGNLARGYADTKIESDVIGGSPYNTIAVFNSTGVNSAVIAPGGSAPPAAGPLADGLSETLREGHAAIAPAATVSVAGSPAYGWWDVDPSTGSTVGRMTGGAGDAAVEYGFVLRAYSAVETAEEADEAMKACGESAAECGSAICKGAFAGGLMYRTFKHAAHVRSWQSLVGHFAFDAGVEVIKVGFCSLPAGHEGGGEGGGGGGGEPPPDPGPPSCEPPYKCD